MKVKKLTYYASVDKFKAPGVFKKINDTMNAALELNYNANVYFYNPSISSRCHFLKNLIFCSSDYVLIRFDYILIPILFFILIYLRLKGKVIIIDIPTPRVTALGEIDNSNNNRIFKMAKKAIYSCFGSWFLMPANRIIQYADENRWFSLGIRNKTIKIGNGILINSDVSLVESVWPDGELKLIGVAQLANWHGYDRLIKAIHVANKMNLPYKISFTIVGDGESRGELEGLVRKLGLEHCVFFTGMLTGKSLDEIFLDKHLGISSLGLYRKGLSFASDLKTREYMARGLTVLGVGEDPDIEVNSPYRITVTNDESIETIVDFLISLERNTFANHNEVRQFAVNNLSFKVKFAKMLESL